MRVEWIDRRQQRSVSTVRQDKTEQSVDEAFNGSKNRLPENYSASFMVIHEIL